MDILKFAFLGYTKKCVAKYLPIKIFPIDKYKLQENCSRFLPVVMKETSIESFIYICASVFELKLNAHYSTEANC